MESQNMPVGKPSDLSAKLILVVSAQQAATRAAVEMIERAHHPMSRLDSERTPETNWLNRTDTIESSDSPEA